MTTMEERLAEEVAGVHKIDPGKPKSKPIYTNQIAKLKKVEWELSCALILKDWNRVRGALRMVADDE